MKKLLLLILLLAPVYANAAVPCVNVFYDRGPDGYWMGRAYATFLQNLLGHFPEFRQIVSPIELYRKGDIEACTATIYLGSYFENKIPQEFLDDFRKAKKNVAWLGYSIWKLGEADMTRLFAHKYVAQTTLDTKNLDQEGNPTFYRWIEYKGEEFRKYSATRDGQFFAPFEQTELARTGPGIAQELAWARHGATGKRIPYALRAGNRFYVADIPFSFMHEADRYLIFTDLLFDILGAKPRNKERLALLRIEDVHAFTPLAELYKTAEVLERQQVRAHYSLIPFFFDPFRVYDRPAESDFVPMDRMPEFAQFLREQKARGARFIWHGVTHQHGRERNPHDGASGSDFEFWDAVKNKPVAEDSADWVLNRLLDGVSTWRAAGLDAPNLWLTPHYQASPLDYVIFGKVFPWNIGRVIYFNNYIYGLPPEPAGNKLWIRDDNAVSASLRANYFKNLEVAILAERWNGQFFPYEIYGDVYGQRLLPENLGNSQPFTNRHVIQPRSVQEMVADAKRNLVLRDAWASFFYHPFLLESHESGGRGEYPGDPAELEYLVSGVKALGYRFVDAEEFIRSKNAFRPEPVYRELEK